MFSMFHSRQLQRLLEGFYYCHLVQLPQARSPCTYHTTMFHRSKPRACNIKIHRYIV